VELEEATVAELSARMVAGETTAAALAEAYLDRISSIDPDLHAVIETNPDALRIAADADAERAEGRVRGPMHGIPVLIKDNIDTADGMKTTAGSLALVDARPARDADVVRHLREAGAVIIGKTNLSEWANIRSTRSSSGWSARGGQTNNPYALDRNPCGSSSGSGAAVSASLCAVAIGTETDGSIVCPSSANGVVGIKPTVGLVGGAGIIPISHTQDTAGPMGRTVADAAALLSAIALPPPDGHPRLEVAALGPDGARGTRIGVARELAGFHDQVDGLFEEALAALRELGAEVVDPADIPHAKDLEEPELEVLLYEFKADVEAYLEGTTGDRPRTLAELIAFNEEHRADEMPFFGQELFLRAAEKGPLTDPAYLDALGACRRLSRDEGLDAVLGAHRLDAIVAPTGGPAWLTDHVLGDHPYSGGDSAPPAVAGYPNITVPMGFIAGLPVGLSFMGPAWSEPSLIRIAGAYEAATTHRRAPKLPASIDA
jgi:amidase